MKIEQIYEKYKHLDKILSDQFLMNKGDMSDEGYILRKMLYEFWQAIKYDIGEINEKKHIS